MPDDEAEFLQKLREAFQIEAREHLQAMTAGLIEIESSAGKAGDSATLREKIEIIFREAHSLKGAARSVNRIDIESVCQAIESVFSTWKKKDFGAAETSQISREAFDTLSRAIDSVDQLLALPDAAPEKKETSALIAELREIGTKSAAAKPSAEAAPKPPAEPHTETKRQPEEKSDEAARDTFQQPQPQPDKSHDEPPKPVASGFAGVSTEKATEKTERLASETVRISTTKMDALLREAEEMLVIKNAVAQLAEESREAQRMMQAWRAQWLKTVDAQRSQTKANDAQKSDDSEQQRLRDFFEINQRQLRALDHKLSALAASAEQERRATGGLIDRFLGEAKQLVMLPFSTLLDFFPKQVRDLARDQEKEIDLVLRGREIEIDKRILEELKDPLTHLVRNAIDHGIEKPDTRAAHNKPPRGTLSIVVSQIDASKVEIVAADDGNGIDAEKVKAAAVKSGAISSDEAARRSDAEALMLIFQSGVSTSATITEISGRGLGMAIVREKIEKLGGHIAIETQPQRGTIFRITLPVTLATFRGLLVSANGQPFIIPISNLERALRVTREEIKTVENRETISWNGRVVALARLGDLLEMRNGAHSRRARPDEKSDNAEKNGRKFLQIVILSAGETRIAFVVDEVLGDQEILVKPLEKPLVRVRNIAAATVLGGGRVTLILSVPDLLKSAARAAMSDRGTGFAQALRASDEAAKSAEAAAETKTRSILVADDSVTSRMLLKNILEAAGYDVKTAVDGVDALTLLKTRDFDGLVSDVEMPRMNGFDLTTRIRADAHLSELPVVLVTARETREDRERGVDAGANAYIIKSSFDQSNLLEVMRRLLGK